MDDYWDYDRVKRFDGNGGRWHFVQRIVLGQLDDPLEIYFRNDDHTEYGLIRFEHRKDNPYRIFPTLINKIMNDAEFRRVYIDNETRHVWRKSWK